MVWRLEDGQRSRREDGADRLAVIEREQEAQIGDVRFEQREPAEVVGAVAGNDREPGVEQVVGLLEQAAIVDGQTFIASAA